jgi:hypothetical protein
MNSENGNTVWVKAWTPAGFSASITLGFEGDIPHADEVERRLQAAGWLMGAPDLDAGQKAETIVTVMRRETPNGAPVVDFYPVWNGNGTFGVNRCGFMYLDTPEQIQQFEAQSGLTLKNIPLYEGQAPLKRTFGKTHKYEVACKTPFDIVKTPDGNHENGMPKYLYDYRVPKVVAPAVGGVVAAGLIYQVPTASASTPAPSPSASPDFTPSPDEEGTDSPSWVKDKAAIGKMLKWAMGKGICTDEAGLWKALGGKESAKKIETPKLACEQLALNFLKPA